jgi:hypothetical protein
MFVTLRKKVPESFEVREMSDIAELSGPRRPQNHTRGVDGAATVDGVAGFVGSAMAQFRSALCDRRRGRRSATPAKSAVRSKREFASDADPCTAYEPVAGFVASR